jgi:hypothetical protein
MSIELLLTNKLLYHNPCPITGTLAMAPSKATPNHIATFTEGKILSDKIPRL